ncbi:MAG: hypothetical protein WBQ53_04925 [Methylocystis sp.]
MAHHRLAFGDEVDRDVSDLVDLHGQACQSASEIEARLALEELRRTVIEVEMPEAGPHRCMLRDATIEQFLGVRFTDPSQWFSRLPTFIRQGCDSAQKVYLERIREVIDRIV